MKVLFTYDYGDLAREKIRDLGYQVDYIHETELEKYDDYQGVDVLVCYKPFTQVPIEKFENLKLILLSSIGIDQVPKAAVEAMGVTVCNNKGGYSIPIGEWIVMKSLELLKNSKAMYNNQRQAKWHMDTTAEEMYNKTVLFLGTGTIAFEAAKRLQGFDVKVLGTNTTGHAKEFFDVCYPMQDIKQHISKADVIVVTLPYTDKTHHFFDKELIDLMNPNAYLINIARGSIMDETYLTQALKNKKIRGAALDVFEKEPLDQDNPLWSLENVIVTSHNCWISEMRNERRFETILKNLDMFIKDKDLVNVVDLNKGY